MKDEILKIQLKKINQYKNIAANNFYIQNHKMNKASQAIFQVAELSFLKTVTNRIK